MPTYGYECQACKVQFETVQRITEDALRIHEGCGGALKRLLYPVGIVFKGSGFYVNDYGKTGKKEGLDSSTGDKGNKEDKEDKKAETKTESKSETASETGSENKSDSKPEPKSDSKSESKTETKSEPAATAKPASSN